MKKEYINPSIRTRIIQRPSILAGTTVANGGSNSNGGPTIAESKSNFLNFIESEGEDE